MNTSISFDVNYGYNYLYAPIHVGPQMHFTWNGLRIHTCHGGKRSHSPLRHDAIVIDGNMFRCSATQERYRRVLSFFANSICSYRCLEYGYWKAVGLMTFYEAGAIIVILIVHISILRKI